MPSKEEQALQNTPHRPIRQNARRRPRQRSAGKYTPRTTAGTFGRTTAQASPLAFVQVGLAGAGRLAEEVSCPVERCGFFAAQPGFTNAPGRQMRHCRIFGEPGQI